MNREPLALALACAYVCDRDSLRRLLDESLSERQEEELTRHLSECVECRSEFERLIGGRDEWSKISDALKREAESREESVPGHDDGDALPNGGATADFPPGFFQPSPDPQALGRVGDIEILEVIGRGGMGIVLKGYQSELKRLVAVKALAPHLAVIGSARRRFAREAQAAAAILHPNVMPILTVHSAAHPPYLVMPYVAGESLQQRLDRDGPLEIEDILRIGMQIAGGLAAAHAQGLAHRDVKPANVLLETGVDRAMLTDFGLARAIDDASVTRSGVIAGTPQYMSPEQARGDPLDHRSDLFSLGSTLYAMAAGRPPFRAESTYGVLRRITDVSARSLREINPRVPDWLEAVIAKLMAKEPADRFPTAQDAAKLLEQCLAHVQQPKNAPLPRAAAELLSDALLTLDSPRRRSVSRAAKTLAVASVVVLTLLAFFSPRWISRPDRSQPDPASDRVPIEWDSAAEQVRGLMREGDRFETRARRLWDNAPESPPPSTP